MFARTIPAVAIALSSTACAGTRVLNIHRTAPEGHDRPQTLAIVIENESAPPARHIPTGVGEKLEAKRLRAVQTVMADLQQGLSKTLAERGLAIVAPGQPADLTLRCRIEAIGPGSKALRIALGMGTGKAILRMNLALTGSDSTLLAFDTRSTTGNMPGVAIGPVPSSGAPLAIALAGKAGGVAGGLKSGLQQETDQTIRQIDAQLRAYFVSQHWPYATD